MFFNPVRVLFYRFVMSFKILSTHCVDKPFSLKDKVEIDMKNVK